MSKMEMSCECQAIPIAREELSVRIDDKRKTVEKISLDFGKVAVFGHYLRIISIENLGETDISSYRIKRDVEVDDMYQVFDFDKKEGFQHAGKRIKLKITYTPKIPFQIDLDHFEFVDSNFNIIRITVKGESIGPQLSTSAKFIYFTLKHPKQQCKKVLEIKNATEIPAEFKFDIDENEELFQVAPKQGIIEKHIYINVTFAPKELGKYSQQLACLVFGHNPLIIDLFGVYSNVQNTVTSKPYIFPFEETIGYGAYLRDIGNIRKTVPPVSLTKSNIDFERFILGGNKTDTASQTTSLTNHMKNIIEVDWIEDNRVFRVFPKRARIPPGDSALFELCFVPTENYGIFGKTILAQIHWSPEPKSIQPTKELSYIPLSLSVNLQGITYPDDHYFISQIEIIPSKVVFPPCLPGELTHSNFKILNNGPLAVTYKIIPPENSNIIVKPAMGVIKQSAIIVVQLRTPRKVCRISEKWHLMLNNQESKKIPLILSGISTLPSIVLGKTNVIEFDAVQPGTHTIQTFPLRNTSHLHIRFEIISPDNVEMKIQPMEGEIPPHDNILVTFHHIANICSPKRIVLNCKIQATQKMVQSVGEVFVEEFVIYADAIYSQLCAAPNFHDFELVQWGRTIDSEFRIFNFGTTTINFHMLTSQRSYNKDTFEISPENGSLNPGEQITIRFKGCATTLGDNDIRITYENRISDNSLETTNQESIELFQFAYCCQFTTLQITEIVEHNFGPLFGKNDFWFVFNIQRLNSLLQNITPRKPETVEMFLPDFEIGSGPFYVTFLIENKTIFDTEIKFKRKKVCDCPMKSVQCTFNSDKRVFDCPHRKMFTMEINDTSFQKNSRRLLTIHVKYIIPGDTNMAYTLNIGDDRFIELLFRIHTIPVDTRKISCYSREYLATMENISIDRRVPPIQIFWLYNNTKMSVNYKMDTSEITRINQRERFDIWKCINPGGEIEPYQSWPLMFKFQPIEVKAYKIPIPIDFGYTTKTLVLLGHGILAMRNPTEILYDMPPISRTTDKFPVTLSASYLIFNSLPVWNTREQIIFINNVSKDRIIQYEWAETRITNIMNITASPKSGVLQPKESQTILVRVKSFNEACIVKKLLSCTLTDYNQMFLHKTSVVLYDQKIKEEEDHFTLTEGGEQNNNTENDIILHDIPQPYTISIGLGIDIRHDHDIRLSPNSINNPISWFAWSPREDMDINITNIIESFTKSKVNRGENTTKNGEIHEHRDFFRRLLEELITDVTFGKTFSELLRNSVTKVPPYYYQITMDDRLNRKSCPVTNDSLDKLRQNEIRRFLEKPTFSVISGVLKELILDSIQETFKLGVTYPIEAGYKKMDKEAEELLKICKDCFCKFKKT